jgi:hypothetical protein
MRLGVPLTNQMWLTVEAKLDVAHSLAAHLRARDLDPALVADDPLVPDALVLPAGALPVLGRAENALAEQPVSLGLQVR